MVRRYWSLVALAALSTLVLFLQTLFTGKGTYFRVPVVFISLIFVIASVRYIEHRLAPPAVTTLRLILNSCAKKASSITSVAKFLIETDERSLIHGDEVHIITNSLRGYDMTPPARAVIARNLKDGVRYVYYVPHGSEYQSLENEKEGFVAFITQEAGLPSRVIEENLRIYLIDEPCLFNFAVVLRAQSSSFEGYWYITTPSLAPAQISGPSAGAAIAKPDPSLNPSLVILELDKALTDQLWGVVCHLKLSSVRVSAVGMGLRPFKRHVFTREG